MNNDSQSRRAEWRPGKIIVAEAVFMAVLWIAFLCAALWPLGR